MLARPWVDDAGDRRAAASLDVGRGAGDGAGGGEAAEERGGDVGQALGDEFLVGIVAVVDLAVGDARREQRFDGAEQGDGDRRRDQLAEIMHRHVGEAEIRQLLRNAVEAAADGFDRQVESEGGQRADDQHHQRRRRPAQQREAIRQAVVGKQEDKAGAGQRQRWQVDGVGVGGQRLDAGEKLGGQVVYLQAEEILDLGEEDDDGDAVGEADHHGHRDEADQLPHARDAHGEQENAGQDRGAHQVGETVDGDDAVHNGDEGAGRAADLHPRAAAGGGDEAGDDGGPDAGCRRRAGGDGKGHGQRQGEDADRDAGGEILAELRAVVGRQAVQQLRVEGDLHGARSGGIGELYVTYIIRQ
jgi:hypothetical protein